MEIVMLEKKPKLLLHICCAGCGAFVSRLLKKNFAVTLFFSNSNIFPREEYIIRQKEVIKIAKLYNLQYIIDEYNHQDWLNHIKGLEAEPEKGRRCWQCYKYRMEKVAQEAYRANFDYFSTTLSVSPHKVYKYIKEIGDELADKYKIKFYDRDYKKKEGAKQASALSCELGLYRQNYCGCEFSRR